MVKIKQSIYKSYEASNILLTLVLTITDVCDTFRKHHRQDLNVTKNPERRSHVMVLTTERLRATNMNNIAMVNVQIRRQRVGRQQSKEKDLISVSAWAAYQVSLHSKKIIYRIP